MDDDLDTPGALATVFDLARRANAAADAGDDSRAARAARTAALLRRRPRAAAPHRGRTASVDDDAAELVRARDEARSARDWARADALRDELEAAGWLVEDGAGGTRIRRR